MDLRLRDLTLNDEAAIHTIGSDPVVTEYTDWGPNTPEETRAFLRESVEAAQQVPRDNLTKAVTLPDGTLIGTAGLRVVNDHSGELGYTIHPSYWGRGFATAATGLLLELAFGELGLHRVSATCRPENIGSRRVLEKSGFSYEGRMRDHKLIRGEWRDSLLFAVLATD